MATQYVVSRDGTRIAYEIKGQGPAIMLLHGAGKTRQDWTKIGYVDRLIKDFTVITMDLRGMGESEIKIEEADYSMDKLCDDLCAIADACGIQRFTVWGYSLGGSIARYFASKTDRVTALVIVGAPLGQMINAKFDQYADGFIAQWKPVVKAYKEGTLSSVEEKSILEGGVLVWSALFPAMQTWPLIKPKDIRCPVLLVVGSEDQDVMEWVKSNQEACEGCQIDVKIVQGTNHNQEFTDIEKTYPVVEAFLSSSLQ
ncbi:MAG: alpha/beta hydrolase [Chloroflexi bacterium]|nr:MAG: alpha/beta hydrolase [Chloroflexota bacterium]